MTTKSVYIIYMNNKEPGYVYILTNPSFREGCLKVFQEKTYYPLIFNLKMTYQIWQTIIMKSL